MNKVRGIFLKEVFARFYSLRQYVFCMYMCICVCIVNHGHGYTTPGHRRNRVRTPVYYVHFLLRSLSLGGARGAIVIVVGNEHGNTSSNPGRDWLHFT